MKWTRGFGSTINHNNYKNFEEVLNHLVCNSTSICAHRAVHYIFDSYCESSLKASERNRRHTSIIRLARIASHTPIPVQMDKFWGCNANKVELQHYASDYIINNFHQISESDVIVSGIIDNENLTPAKLISCGNSVIEIPALQLKIEEADMRLIPHAYWLLSWSSKIVIVSNDTDVLCLLLYYAEEFFNKGMEQLWLRVGVSASRRFIPVHILAQRLGSDKCRCILKAHIGSGCDYLSKVGTKCGAMKAYPETHLNTFAESDSITKQEVDKAEAFLVQCYQVGTSETSFDSLRYNYLKNRHCVLQLPPTSTTIRDGHILRWWYLTRYSMSLLNINSWSKSPLDNGWEMSNSGSYLPSKHLYLLPDVFSSRCSCKNGCRNKRCGCKKFNTLCTDYCACSSCENKS